MQSRTHDPEPNVLVLLSGGIDSTACVAFYIEHDFSVGGLFVDYGQSAAHHEANAAQAIAGHYGIPLETLQWSAPRTKGAGLIMGRNAFLLSAALMECKEGVQLVAIGVHGGTSYVDCTPDFLRRVQAIFDLYANGKVQIGAPFLSWRKRDVWEYCKSRLVPLGLTYSCERGLQQPCGKCDSCKDLEGLCAGA